MSLVQPVFVRLIRNLAPRLLMIYLMSWQLEKPAKMTEKEPEMVPFFFHGGGRF